MPRRLAFLPDAEECEDGSNQQAESGVARPDRHDRPSKRSAVLIDEVLQGRARYDSSDDRRADGARDQNGKHERRVARPRRRRSVVVRGYDCERDQQQHDQR